MALRNRMMWILLILATMWTAPPAAGQADQPKEDPATEVAAALDSGRTPAAATIEKIMEQAVRNIAVRYNLNDAQTEETRELMKRKVHRFLKEHENEVWPAIRDLVASRLGAKPPENREEMMRIGKAAKPLAKFAKEAIFRANEEWRIILTVEQREMHDFDLEEMHKSFEQIDKNLGDWEQGRLTEHGIFPTPEITGREPRRPGKPPKGRLPEPVVEGFDPNHFFDTFVEEFIKEYELDEGQITSARSILQEFKTKANDYKVAEKLEFAKIAARQREAMLERDLKAIKRAAAAHKKLLEPVYVLCDEMDDRLKGLLTTAQIQRHADKSTGAKETPKAAGVTKKTSSKKATPPTTEPVGPDLQATGDKE